MIIRLDSVDLKQNLWRCEPQLSFDAFTIHASGWKLHNIKIGNRCFINHDNHGLLLVSPVRIVGKGEIAMYVDILLSPNSTQTNFLVEEPFIVIEPRPALKEQQNTFVHQVQKHHCCHCVLCGEME